MISKKIFKDASGAKQTKYFDRVYDSIISNSTKYGIDTESKLLAFLSQVGVETGGFFYSEETGSDSYFDKYDGRTDLGNVQTGDGAKYKGRAFLQLTGRTNYNKVSKFLKQDFITNPESLAPTNSDLRKNTINQLELDNAVGGSMYYWQKGSSWGDLNSFAAKIDLKNFDIGNFYNIYPTKYKNENAEVKRVLGLKPKRNASNSVFITDRIGLSRSSSFYYFELICLGINGGYNGFKERLENFINAIESLGYNDYKDFNKSNNYDNQNNTDSIDDINYNDDVQSGQDSNKSNVAYGGITNFFKPTIDLKPIEFDVSGTPDTSLHSDIGYSPFVWFNDIQISTIESFILSCKDFLPTIQLTFIDNYSTFNAKNFPLDNSKIKVFLNSSSTYLKSVMLEFKVLSFVKQDNAAIYKISGILNIDNLLLRKYKAYRKMTSFDALQNIAKESGLGFSSNINGTDDLMTWLNVGYTGIQHVKNMINHSYMSDDSFMLGYVDLFYNLVYIDIETQLKLNVSDEIGIFNIPLSDMGNRLSKDNLQDVSPLYLTNDDSHKDTNNYIEDFTIFNKSTETSLDNGYISTVKFYDINQKEMLIFDIDSISSEGDKNIVLKGSGNDKLFFEQNTNTSYEGKIDNSNMHKNYCYASVQNNHNISEIEKIGMELTITSPNFNIYKFQKLSIVLIHKAPDFMTPTINKRLSGDWLVLDMDFIYVNNSMSQTIRLVRRDLGLLDDEELPTIQSSSNRGDEIVNNNDTDDNENDIAEEQIEDNIIEPEDVDVEIVEDPTLKNITVEFTYPNIDIDRPIFNGRSIHSVLLNYIQTLSYDRLNFVSKLYFNISFNDITQRDTFLTNVMSYMISLNIKLEDTSASFNDLNLGMIRHIEWLTNKPMGIYEETYQTDNNSDIDIFILDKNNKKQAFAYKNDVLVVQNELSDKDLDTILEEMYNSITKLNI